MLTCTSVSCKSCNFHNNLLNRKHSCKAAYDEDPDVVDASLLDVFSQKAAGYGGPSLNVSIVFLQELKNLLLEAHKGPESLQEALKVQAGNHRTQQDELRALIDSLRLTLTQAFSQRGSIPLKEDGGWSQSSSDLSLSALKDLHNGNQEIQSLLKSLPLQLRQLEQSLGRVEDQLLMVTKLLETEPQTETWAGSLPIQRPGTEDRSETVVRSLEETRRTLGGQIRTNTVYNAVFTYTAAAICISAVYLLLRGAA